MNESKDALGRREVVAGLLGVGAMLASGCRSRVDAAHHGFAEIEARSGGRLGIAIVDWQGQELGGHRASERFAMCSTFKLPLVALILGEVEAGHLDLDQPVPYGEEDMVPYAPVTGPGLAAGSMTVAQLAEAAQTRSDNVAANLLLERIGGPSGFTSGVRALGDHITRLDRYEPGLNLVPEAEVRDTTTPGAMAQLVRTLIAGSALNEHSVRQLKRWTLGTVTGRDRLRSGLPDAWPVGNKTGTGIAESMPNKVNAVAIAWPCPHHDGFVVSAYQEADRYSPRTREADVEALRSAGAIATRIVTASSAQQDAPAEYAPDRELPARSK